MRFVLFFLFPALELYLLVKVGGLIGAVNMVLWVFASACIGMWAIRAQGQNAMLKARAELDAGRVPQLPFLDGLLLFLGGLLLILPGLITDAAGLLLLLPPVRRRAAPLLAGYITTRQTSGTNAGVWMFVFKSGGFPGSGAPSAKNSFPRQEHAVFHETPLENTQPPRQATIIESTAIAIERPLPPEEPESGNSTSGNKD